MVPTTRCWISFRGWDKLSRIINVGDLKLKQSVGKAGEQVWVTARDFGNRGVDHHTTFSTPGRQTQDQTGFGDCFRRSDRATTMRLAKASDSLDGQRWQLVMLGSRHGEPGHARRRRRAKSRQKAEGSRSRESRPKFRRRPTAAARKLRRAGASAGGARSKSAAKRDPFVAARYRNKEMAGNRASAAGQGRAW